MTLGFYMVLFEIESAAGSKKKTCKNEESQQTIGPPYLVMEYEVSKQSALTINDISISGHMHKCIQSINFRLVHI